MTAIRNIIFSPGDSRLRAGWRIVCQTVGMLFLITCLAAPFALSLETLTSGTGLLLAQVAQFTGITLSVFLARRFLDKRSFTSLGLRFDRRTFTDLLTGLVIAFVMMTVVFGIGLSLGWVRVQTFAWESESLGTVAAQTLLALLTFILVGWSEELLSRGYHLQNLSDGLNQTWGIVLSSTIFGVLHMANFNASWAGAVGIFFAGVFFAFSYLRTNQLWLPIGLHIGWNFFEGVVFGYPVSGLGTFRLLRITVAGPELWTGGSFGPEAGLVLVPALLLGSLLVHLYTRSRKG